MKKQKQGIYECENCGINCGTVYRDDRKKWICGDCYFLLEWYNTIVGKGKQTKYGKCKKCGEVFEKRTPNGKSYPKKIFCSSSCSVTSYQRQPQQGFQKGEKNPSKRMSLATRKKMSETMKKMGTRPPPPKKGSASNFWKGGTTSAKMKIKKSADWKKWRASVFARDLFTCKECGVRGVYIEPHHIKPVRLVGLTSTELFNTNNGITLCRPCHKKTMWKEEHFIERYSKMVA